MSWRMSDFESRPPREPIFNAPWPPVAICLLMIVCYLGQGRLSDASINALALRPSAVLGGQPLGLVTHMFLHGGWLHVLMNAGFCLAFGAPVSRLLGEDGKGAALTALFFLTCGVMAGLVYVAIHPTGDQLVVGASGAVYGLMGAASRLIDWGGVLGPIRSRTVLSMAAVMVVLNLLIGVFGDPMMGGAAVAWEAHLAGFAVGLFLIGPVARLAQRH